MVIALVKVLVTIFSVVMNVAILSTPGPYEEEIKNMPDVLCYCITNGLILAFFADSGYWLAIMLVLVAFTGLDFAVEELPNTESGTWICIGYAVILAGATISANPARTAIVLNGSLAYILPLVLVRAALALIEIIPKVITEKRPYISIANIGGVVMLIIYLIQKILA